MPAFHHQTLFRSPLVTISDVGCRAPKSRSEGEEHSGHHELVFVRSGVFVKQVRGREVVAEPAHVLFFNAGEPYRVSHPVSGGDDCTTLSFGVETIADVLTHEEPTVQDRLDAPFVHTHGPLGASAMLRQQALRRRIRAGCSALETEETALGLLQHTVAEARCARGEHPRRPRNGTARARRELVESAKLVLASQPRANPSLSALAREVSSSPFHLARLFRAEAGMPVHQFLLRVRLALALERMTDDHRQNLSSLALDLGFSSHSHFTAVFRRSFGVAPSDFRAVATGPRVREMRKNLEA